MFPRIPLFVCLQGLERLLLSVRLEGGNEAAGRGKVGAGVFVVDVPCSLPADMCGWRGSSRACTFSQILMCPGPGVGFAL